MIEESISSLTAAIEALTAVLKNSATEAPAAAKRGKVKAETPAAVPAAATPDSAPAADTPPAGPTRADVSKLAQKCLDAGLVDKIRAVYSKIGGKKLDDIPVEKYPEVIEQLNGLLTAKAEEPKPEPAPASTVTLDQIKALGAKIRDAGHVDKLRPIVTALGVKKLAETPEAKFAETYASLQKIDEEITGGGDPV